MFDSDSFLLKSDALDDKRPAIQINNFPWVCPSQRDFTKANQQTSSSNTLGLSQPPIQPTNEDDIPQMEHSGQIFQSDPGLIEFSKGELDNQADVQYTSYSDGSMHIADELEPRFLSAHNRDLQEQSKFPQIWEDLHFLIYRFHWLDATIIDIDRLEQRSDRNMLVIKYFLTKALIIMTEQFIANIKVTENICKYAQWNQFLEETKQLRRVIKDLKEQLYEKEDRLQELYQQIMTTQNNNNDNNLYQLTSKYITQDVGQKDFNEIKFAYRTALKQLYQISLENVESNNTENIEFYAKLQFLIIVSMLINNIFTDQRENSLQIIKNCIKVNKLISPTQVEKFLRCASVDDLIKQTKQLYEIYFATKK